MHTNINYREHENLLIPEMEYQGDYITETHASSCLHIANWMILEILQSL